MKDNNQRYAIYFEMLDDNGNRVSTGVYYKTYTRFGYAERVAKSVYGDSKRFNYAVRSYDPKAANINPFEESDI
jgi:hypothetical protein